LRQTSGVPRPEDESRGARERRLWPRAPGRVDPLRFRQVPLLAAALCFAVGEAVTRMPGRIPAPTVLLFGSALALAALTGFTLRRMQRLTLVPLAALWFAAGLWSAQIEPLPSPQSPLTPYADGLSRRVQAHIVRIRRLPTRAPASPDTPYGDDAWDEPGTPALSLDLDVTAIEEVTPDRSRMVPVRGGVRGTLLATGAATGFAPHCGDAIEAPMRLRLPERYRDPGAWQLADYLLTQGTEEGIPSGLSATGSVPANRVSLLPSSGATAHCRLFAAQTWAAERLAGYARSLSNRRLPRALRLTPDDAGMLGAMLFGDRTRLNHTLRAGFERTGSFHLFVVSGLHVTLLAGLIFWLARRLRLREGTATALTIVLATAYAALTGFGVPVQRALLMTAVYLLARLLGRESSRLNALGAAALAVLLWSPHALFEASFQMTFLAIVAIAGIAIPLGHRTFMPYAHAARHPHQRWRDTTLPPRLAQFRLLLRVAGEPLAAIHPRAAALPAWIVRMLLYAAELTLIGAVAEAVMVLPMALSFHRATVFALPANMLSIPLVAVLAPLGVVTFLASLASPWLAAIPGAATALVLHGITAVIGRVSHLHAADLRVPGPPVWAALLAVACLGVAVWGVRRSRRGAFAAVALLSLAAGLALWPQRPELHPGQLEVTALDVGQGDSLLIVGPGGATMLMDAGGPTGAAANAENAATAAAFDTGEEIVSPYLWSRQIRRLDVVALSHAHSDHMGGMPAVLRNFRPRELWLSIDPNAPAFRDLLAEAADLGIVVRHLHAGDTLAWDATQIAVLAPEAAYANHGAPVNDDSLVLRLQYGRASVLLEGDAEAPSERAMEGGHRISPVTLLKVGHHGSRTSTTPEFLALAAPRDAVISVGRNNTFGHPRAEIVQRLAAAHVRLFRTDQFGLTTFLLDRNGTIVERTAVSDR
jgi:competence protein ComEC